MLITSNIYRKHFKENVLRIERNRKEEIQKEID